MAVKIIAQDDVIDALQVVKVYRLDLAQIHVTK